MQVCARRSRAGSIMAAAVALMCAGVISGTDAAGGQSGVEISVGEAELSPSEVAAGETVTVRSMGFACASGADDHTGLVWAVFPRGEFEWGEHLGWEPADALASGVGIPNSASPYSGAWSATFPAPDVGAHPPGGEIGPGSPVTSPELRVFGPLPFTVDGEHELDFVAKCYSYPSATGDVAVSPEVPEIGGSATATPLDPCPMPHTEGGWVDVGVMKVPEGAGPANPDGIEFIDLSPVDPAADGSWSVTFQIPDEPGNHYGIVARCRNVEGGQTLGYRITPFDVREPGGPPIETPPGFWDDVPVEPGASVPPVATAPPARPVRADPTYTG